MAYCFLIGATRAPQEQTDNSFRLFELTLISLKQQQSFVLPEKSPCSILFKHNALIIIEHDSFAG